MIEEDDKVLQQELLQRLVDNKLTGPSMQVSFYCNPQHLPEKKLPHGNLSSLFALYCAYSQEQDQEAAGRSIFYTVAQKWKVCLKFHKPSMHSVCTTCTSLKSQLANATATWQWQCT